MHTADRGRARLTACVRIPSKTAGSTTATSGRNTLTLPMVYRAGFCQFPHKLLDKRPCLASFLRVLLIVAGVALFTTGCTLGLLFSREVGPKTFTALNSFTIHDPYAKAGEWYKVQLHVHTAASIDSQWPSDAALQAYADRDYDFVALSDHDIVTLPSRVPDGLVVIPAEENTVPNPYYPLGSHAVFLFVTEHVTAPSIEERFKTVTARGGLVSLAHPSWNGNLGHGKWELWQALVVPQFSLVEVFNPFSNTQRDEAFWHEIVMQRGPDRPVWAIAVDDAHDASAIDRGWTMVKASSKTLDGLKDALDRGSLYPTTGLQPEFWVAAGMIHTSIAEFVRIEFVDGHGTVVKRLLEATEGSYEPAGHEGFIRIRLYDPATGNRAWSQPFWLLAN